jgi:hypothetical protein
MARGLEPLLPGSPSVEASGLRKRPVLPAVMESRQGRGAGLLHAKSGMAGKAGGI